jgi:hypothetical protein
MVLPRFYLNLNVTHVISLTRASDSGTSVERNAVIQPSSSPCKKGVTHRFRIDYRDLNAVTVPNTFPLPVIDDLLDKLDSSQH